MLTGRNQISAPDALARLVEGNERYCAGSRSSSPGHAEYLGQGRAQQPPFAVIVTCADSRIIPELIFDQGAGDLYVTRVAGNILDDAVLGSVEFAVGQLGVNLVLVMGHEGCGAVKATVDHTDGQPLDSPHLDELVRAIRPAVDQARTRAGDLLANAVRANALRVAERLMSHKLVLGPKVETGALDIRAAYFDLGSGKVELLERDASRRATTLQMVNTAVARQVAVDTHVALHESVTLLDPTASTLTDLVFEVLQQLHEDNRISNEALRRIEARLRDSTELHAQGLGHGIGVVRIAADELTAPRVVLARCPVEDLRAADGTPLSFVWVVFGPNDALEPDIDELEPFGWMLVDDRFAPRALAAAHCGELVPAYEAYLDFIEHPSRAHRSEPPEELRRSGKLMGGVLNDIRRRLPHYSSDFTEGLNTKTLASALFLFFACLAPAVAFGGLLFVMTEGSIGAVEMLVATAICGVTYSLVGGQPLTILGSTGPVIIFLSIIYQLCVRFSVPFFPTICWTGIWTAAILMLLAATETSALIRYFTRFTDEIFAALISLIFIVEALKDTFKGFTEDGVPHDTALLSLVLALGTFVLAQQLSRFRRSVYLRGRLREFLADFGPAIAIAAMTGIAVWLHPVKLQALAVPDTVATSSGRPWLVNPLDAPVWVWFGSLVPALLMSVLLFLDQNITVRLVNDKRYGLKKGAAYHLDMAVLAVLVLVCSFLGLPWMVAATVRSLNHVRSLADFAGHSGERIVRVRETRVSSLLVHLMIGASLLVLPLLSKVPMSVLFGLFLYMGIASLRNNQFFDRLRLWLMDPRLYPPTHYLRRVPTQRVHLFTGIQFCCLAVLWAVKTSALGIFFPLFIGMLVPIRLWLVRLFEPEHLAHLDAEEEPEEEADRALT